MHIRPSLLWLLASLDLCETWEVHIHTPARPIHKYVGLDIGKYIYRVETRILKRPRSERILVYGPGFGGTEPIIFYSTCTGSINNPICSKSPTPFVGQHKKSKTYEKQKCVAVPQVVREEPLLWVAAKVPRPEIVHG
jgi:hypothetical protein